MELTEKQQAFLEYLLDPSQDKPTQVEWCRLNDAPVRTVQSWKRHKLFREEWDRRAKDLYSSPEKVNRIVDALWEKAAGGDVKAAQLYLQFVDKFTPKQQIVTESKGLAEMSDEELAALGENVIALRENRA